MYFTTNNFIKTRFKYITTHHISFHSRITMRLFFTFNIYCYTYQVIPWNNTVPCLYVMHTVLRLDTGNSIPAYECIPAEWIWDRYNMNGPNNGLWRYYSGRRQLIYRLYSEHIILAHCSFWYNFDENTITIQNLAPDQTRLYKVSIGNFA